MPTITVYEPDPTFNPYTSPLQATGVYTLDNNANPFVITGTATYMLNGVLQTKNGYNILTGRNCWQMDFDIPDPNVTVTVTASISENGGAAVSNQMPGILMAGGNTEAYFAAVAGGTLAAAPFLGSPADRVEVTFLGTENPATLVAVGRATGGAGTSLQVLFFRRPGAPERFVVTAAIAPTPIGGGYWAAALPVPLAERDGGYVLALLLSATGRVLHRDVKFVIA